MTREFKIRSFDFQSRTDMKVRQTSGYGDNAMEDPTSTNESVEAGESDIDRLHDILSPHISDEAIANGASLSPGGFQKVAAKMGLSVEQVQSLLKSLAAQIEAGGPDVVMGESGSPRYTWEHDGMGSVTIRDGQTGEDHFYGGSKGFAILSAVEEMTSGAPDEQAFLATYCDQPLQEDAGDAVEAETNDDFMSEISADVSTFNFPWKEGSSFGTGTAEFRGNAEKFDVKVVDIRDQNGEQINDASMMKKLQDQAIDFIPRA